MDDRPYKSNQNYDVGLRILTPWYDGGMDGATLRMVSGQGREVLVVLPNDVAFLEELRVYLKIEKFLRLNTSSQLTKYETIKEAKRVEMRERNSNAKLYLTESLKAAAIYVNGDIANVSAKEVTSRINEAIGRLVQTVYHKLAYIDTAMGEADIRKLFKTSNQLSLNLEGGKEANTHALDDVLSYLAGNSRMHMKTSMKTVKDRFMKAPYGFVEDDVQWLVARLFKRGDLSFTVNGAGVTLLNKTEEEIISYITKKQFVEKLLMEERVRVSEREKKAVRTVMKELFGTSGASEDEDATMRNFQNYSKDMISEMNAMEVNYRHYAYPGKKVIEDGKKLLNSVLMISSPVDFFATVTKQQDTFRDLAEDYDPLKSFFGGEQQQLFMRAMDLLEIYEDSKAYITDKKLEDIVSKMQSILKMPQPYKQIPELPELRKQFMDAYGTLLDVAAKPVFSAIEEARKRVIEVVVTKEYAAQKKTSYTQLFIEIEDGAKSCNNVSRLRAYADKADALKIRLLNEMDEMDAKIARQKAEEERRRREQEERDSNTPPEDRPIVPEPEVHVKTTKNIAIKSLTGTASWRVESMQDVEDYLAKLRTALEEELNRNDIVNIEF